MKVSTTAEIMKITPEVASEWLLELWGEQRTIRKGHVDKLASDMRALPRIEKPSTQDLANAESKE